MTSYLGPENPLPIHILSKVNHVILPFKKTSKIDDKLYNFGNEYYDRLSKILWLQAGINIDDEICIISSIKSCFAKELQERLNLIYPIVKLIPKFFIYEELPLENRRDIQVNSIPINAEDYFNDESNFKKFNKIIIVDGLELVENRGELYENMQRHLKPGLDNNIVIFYRNSEMMTLPFPDELFIRFQETEIELKQLMVELMEINWLIGWALHSIPFSISREKWMNQLYNNFPAPADFVPLANDIEDSLKHMMETSFKYSQHTVRIRDTLMLLIVSPPGENIGQPPFQMRITGQLYQSQAASNSLALDDLLRMKITDSINEIISNCSRPLQNYLSSAETGQLKYPEEWWGTIPSMNIGLIDPSRINHSIQQI